jgi:hypothetical protein
MPAATSKSDAETAVRQYLLYLEEPGQLRDEAEVQEKTQAVEVAVDPIDKLKAVADLERVTRIEEGPLREGFVTHAKAWAEQTGVPVSGFREMKVPDDVPRAAGFDVPAGRRGRGAGAGRQRAKAVSVEDIKNYVVAQTGTFLLADIMVGVGGSQATVRKAIDELIDASEVNKLGPVPNYTGRGRAPTQYNRT